MGVWGLNSTTHLSSRGQEAGEIALIAYDCVGDRSSFNGRSSLGDGRNG